MPSWVCFYSLQGSETIEDVLDSITTDGCAVPLAMFKEDLPWIQAVCICHRMNLLFSADLLPRKKPAVDGEPARSYSSSRGSAELREIMTDVKRLLAKFYRSTAVKRNFERGSSIYAMLGASWGYSEAGCESYSRGREATLDN